VDLLSDGETASVEVRPVFEEVQGRAYGWEGLLRLEPTGPFWGWVAVTLGKGERITADGTVFPSDHDQPVSLTLLGAWHGPKRWDVSARFRLTSGHPYTPLVGVYSPEDDRYYAWSGELNTARFPWFHQLDVRVEKTWEKRRGDISLYLDVYNAYWAKNPFAAAYNYDYSELIPIISIPIVPTLGVEAKY
jgi:hypothetical protein